MVARGLFALALILIAAHAEAAPTMTTLFSFNGVDGEYPYSGLIADPAGNLFGTGSGGGAYSVGRVFEIVKSNGTYASAPAVLASFNGTDGDAPTGNLVADAAGNCSV